MMNKTHTETFIIDLNDYSTSIEFSNRLNDFISEFANNNRIIYPNIISMKLCNNDNDLSFTFVYPYLYKDVSYEIFFKEKTTNNVNNLFIKISYII